MEAEAKDMGEEEKGEERAQHSGAGPSLGDRALVCPKHTREMGGEREGRLRL